MRIKALWKYIDDNHLEKHDLSNCTVVVDGQNFFYNLYQKSELPFQFGAESDRYAEYLKVYLNQFKKANIKLNVIFKGGHEDMSTKYKSLADSNHMHGSTYGITDIEHLSDIVLPVFMKDIYKQVLDELCINYVICQFESKKDCIAFAKEYDCPVISFDVEYCFSGVCYIPMTTLRYDEKLNKFNCGMFKLDNFLHKTKLSEEKIAMFLVLTDQKIFPENFFMSFFKSRRIPLNNYKRIESLLRYLSENGKNEILNQVCQRTPIDPVIFLDAENKAKKMIRPDVVPGIPTEYLKNNIKAEIQEYDTEWFAKGLAFRKIAIPYINLYRSKIVIGSGAIADNDKDDAMLLSIDIIRYAYDLLTNFNKSVFHFITHLPRKDTKIEISHELSIPKPCYEANNCVFENGWNNISSLKLFEHFLLENLKGIDLEYLKNVPVDAQLLMIALLYFSFKNCIDVDCEVYSILLSYVVLSLTHEGKTDVQLDDETKNLDANKLAVHKTDIDVAANKMLKYFKVNKPEMREIFDRKMIHPLVEFQHCLQHLNYLNTLCGSSYAPTVYSKTYNATFVYKVLYAIKKEFNYNAMEFLEVNLNSAPSVMHVIKDLIESYKYLINFSK